MIARIILLSCLMLITSACSDTTKLADARRQYNQGQFEQAFKALQPLANSGNAEAQLVLGNMFYEGNGTKKDFKKAFEYTQKSALQNYSPAQLALSLMYLDSKVSVPNKEKSFMWLEKSAMNGFPLAQYILAINYYTGTGVAQDYIKALYFAVNTTYIFPAERPK